jgi:hypothetical protein
VWQEYVDEQGRKYYYCATSGETSWQKPAVNDGAPESAATGMRTYAGVCGRMRTYADVCMLTYDRVPESAAASARAKLQLAVARAREEGGVYRYARLALPAYADVC